MSEEGGDDSSKTEEPTQKKLDDARKKGKIVATRELNHFFMLLFMAFFVFILGPRMGTQIKNIMEPFITRPEAFEISSAGVLDLIQQALGGVALIMLLPLLFSFVAAIAPAVLQGKWVVAASNIEPKLEKISPLAGFKRIFGMKAMMEFLKNFIKVLVIGVAAFLAIRPYLIDMPGLMRIEDGDMMLYTRAMTGRMLIAGIIFLFLLSILDYLYQRFSFIKSQKMTKQEVKDEYKQQEGDPQMKGKLKQIRRDRAKKRMMANVPNADVIVTNPTHYAIALKYDSATMAAPKVLAKGVDDVAMRIRELAEKNKIPLVRNPPLARVLYDTTEIDDAIPVEHYQAVAKIIGYIYRLKNKAPTAPASAGKNAAKTASKPTLNLKK